MGFLSFAGRLLFTSVFLLTAWQEFNEFRVGGGPIAAVFKHNTGLVAAQISSHLGVQLPAIEINHILATTIVLKGIGAILFILGSPVGAYILLLHLAVSTSITHDFYNYNIGEPEFFRLLSEFAQGVALSGALLIFLGMRRKPGPSRQPKKSVPKSKKS
ncbi:hypothetical protein Taro_044792 [Colocasia esculenta]|uniref:Uncharacterized protein n=1 Tax=Colocasia esculenta TaxID=4460 RepID=A0A843X1I3_COLES|nr:hypothetical protein [Colocasia esculenta]